MHHWFTQHRYGWLLTSLIAVYIITPMAGATTKNDLFFAPHLFILVAFCLFSVTNECQNRIITAVFLLPIATVSVLSLMFPLTDSLRIAMHLGFLGFFCVVMLIHLNVLVGTDNVNEDVLAGSVCVYLLFGLVFGLVYSLVNMIEGNAFTTIDNEALFFSDLVYTSMVTLTTVGYGDIVPRTPIARSLSTFQALLGQFYLAILVARFVGLYAANYRQLGTKQ
jgi:hypothetical protein